MSKIKIELDEESFLVLSEMLEDYSFRYADFLQKHGINSALDKQLKLQTKAITVFQTEFYKNKESLEKIKANMINEMNKEFERNDEN